MNFDITQVPFSCRGSYLALSQNEGEFGGRTAEPGLYLRTVRGAAKDPFLARLTPLCGGRPAAFAPQADPACLHLAADGADIDIAFADAATLLLRGRGAAAGLCLDFLSAGRPYTMLEPLPAAEGVYYASCYVSRTRLVLRAQRGPGVHRPGLERQQRGPRPPDRRGGRRGVPARGRGDPRRRGRARPLGL